MHRPRHRRSLVVLHLGRLSFPSVLFQLSKMTYENMCKLSTLGTHTQKRHLHFKLVFSLPPPPPRPHFAPSVYMATLHNYVSSFSVTRGRFLWAVPLCKLCCCCSFSIICTGAVKTQFLWKFSYAQYIFINSCIHSFIHSFIYSFVYSFIY